MSIELHCHTVFSIDGTGTPEALVDHAAERGVSVLAITEHNSLGSADRAAAQSRKRGVRYIPGVEIDALCEIPGEGRRNCHLLGLGVEPGHPDLAAVVAHNHDCYLHQFEQIFPILVDLGFPGTRADLEAFLPECYPTHPAPVLNRYVVTRFAEARGRSGDIRSMLQEARKRMARTDAYAQPGPPARGRFRTFEEARDAVHAAGGRVLLAHVSKVLPDDPTAQEAFIRALLLAGADGFELYHPFNRLHASIEHLANLADELDCLVSGGSDCHHAPCRPPGEIGSCGAPDEIGHRLADALRRS